MKMTHLKTTIAHLSNARHQVASHPVLCCALALAAFAACLASVLADWSAKLSPQQTKDVRIFVVRTDSAVLRDEYNRAVLGEGLTVNKVQRLIEIAKAQEPGYGLITDVEKK